MHSHCTAANKHRPFFKWREGALARSGEPARRRTSAVQVGTVLHVVNLTSHPKSEVVSLSTMAGARKAIYPHVNPVTAPLSEDLWFMIFEIIQKHVELYRMKHYVLPLILVCKTWKRIATPLMYRSTHFASPARLKLFAQHLADGHWRPDAPGPCVRITCLFTMAVSLRDRTPLTSSL